MSRQDVEQATALGDLRIVHRADDGDVRGSLDLMTVELGGKDTRILRVIAPDKGALGLGGLITQLAGHPPSVTAEVPTGTDVERAHLRLTRLDADSARVLLLIEGAHSLQPAALRYIQQVCAATPHVRLGLVWAAPPDRLSDAEFAALNRRPVTELCLKGTPPASVMPENLAADTMPVDAAPADAKPADTKSADTTFAEAMRADTRPADAKPADTTFADTKLAEAMRAEAKAADAKPGDVMPIDTNSADTMPVDTKLTDTKPPNATPADTWEPPTPPAWLIAGALPPSSTPWRAARIGLAISGLVAVLGVGAWILRDGGIQVEAGMIATPAPAERIAVAEAPEPARADKVAENRLEAAPVASAVPEARSKPVAVADPPAVAYATSAPKTGPAPVDATKAETAEPSPPTATAAKIATASPAATGSATAKMTPPAAETAPAVSADLPRPTPVVPAVAIPAPVILAPVIPAPVIPAPVITARAIPAPVIPGPAIPAVASPPVATPVAANTRPAEIVRADRLLETGDISGARRWYEYAAGKGSAIAATSLGRTYDPIVLARLNRLGGVIGEPAKARLWYEKAAAMGDPDAAAALALLNAGH